MGFFRYLWDSLSEMTWREAGVFALLVAVCLVWPPFCLVMTVASLMFLLYRP